MIFVLNLKIFAFNFSYFYLCGSGFESGSYLDLDTYAVPYNTGTIPTIASAPSRRLISLDNRLPVFLSIIFRPNWLHYFYLANFFLLLILFSVFLLPGSGSRSPHKMRSWIRNTLFLLLNALINV